MIYDSTDMTFRIIDWIFIVDNRSVAFFFLVIKPLYFAWTTIIEVVLSRRVCNTDLQRHMVCILMDANFEIRYTFLRTQSFGKRLNDDDGFHFITIPRFCLQVSRPCLKSHCGSSSNSKWFVNTTFVSIWLPNHISCITTKYSWSCWFPDKSCPLSHLVLRQLNDEIQETPI